MIVIKTWHKEKGLHGFVAESLYIVICVISHDPNYIRFFQSAFYPSSFTAVMYPITNSRMYSGT